MDIAAIRIGERRRQNMGDIDGLAASIAEIGLLHPVVVTPDHDLIAGERRIEAFRNLGPPEHPVAVIDLDKIVRGEYAENFFRKAFAPSEIVAIAEAIEPGERVKAKERMVAAHTSPGKFPKQANGRALDHVDTVRAAVSAQHMLLTSDRSLAASMQTWLALSPFARERKLAS